ncbi:MAG: protein phosphatase 2C domain-containing protein [Clostridiales Family XIII bacterium]|jgi:protein phosphatase|nr:protein phosphatase 2C domain-containing protein [Clostridiales Family XIII bacterium]
MKLFTGRAEPETLPANNESHEDELTVSVEEDTAYFAVVTASDLHIGTRPYQQDALYVTETACSDPGTTLKVFGVLCDGMGGMENGEKAGRLTVEQLAKDLDELDPHSDVPAFFESEVAKLDELVCEEVAGGMKNGTGTTLTAVLIIDKDLYWAAVGDSRIYILRSNEILQVTRDHNYMLLLENEVRNGRLLREEAEAHPDKDALISYIGSGNVRFININRAPFRLAHGDVVLQCSDGLTKSLSDDEIKEIIIDHYGDLAETARMLTLQAFDAGEGSKDNTSVILMQYFE